MAVSYDQATALQPGQQSQTLTLKENHFHIFLVTSTIESSILWTLHNEALQFLSFSSFIEVELTNKTCINLRCKMF